MGHILTGDAGRMKWNSFPSVHALCVCKYFQSKPTESSLRLGETRPIASSEAPRGRGNVGRSQHEKSEDVLVIAPLGACSPPRNSQMKGGRRKKH